MYIISNLTSDNRKRAEAKKKTYSDQGFEFLEALVGRVDVSLEPFVDTVLQMLL